MYFTEDRIGTISGLLLCIEKNLETIGAYTEEAVKKCTPRETAFRLQRHGEINLKMLKRVNELALVNKFRKKYHEYNKRKEGGV